MTTRGPTSGQPEAVPQDERTERTREPEFPAVSTADRIKIMLESRVSLFGEEYRTLPICDVERTMLDTGMALHVNRYKLFAEKIRPQLDVLRQAADMMADQLVSVALAKALEQAMRPVVEALDRISERLPARQ